MPVQPFNFSHVRQPASRGCSCRARAVDTVACVSDGLGASRGRPRRRDGGAAVEREWQRLEELHAAQHQVARHEQALQSLVTQQSFAAAAGERDALVAAQLRLRHLQLRAAGAHKACAGVRHRLGQVVRHARYHYRGVVVGYDHECCAPEAWVRAMHVDALPLGRLQPFYAVLVDERDRPGGQTTYVAQENLVAARVPREVQHGLLPRYFSAFSEEEGAYLPSPLLREAYPHDF